MTNLHVRIIEAAEQELEQFLAAAKSSHSLDGPCAGNLILVLDRHLLQCRKSECVSQVCERGCGIASRKGIGRRKESAEWLYCSAIARFTQSASSGAAMIGIG
jgi:hypothetical protein